jgi:hypothetical protein
MESHGLRGLRGLRGLSPPPTNTKARAEPHRDVRATPNANLIDTSEQTERREAAPTRQGLKYVSRAGILRNVAEIIRLISLSPIKGKIQNNAN